MVITGEERERLFREDFKALLKKYNAIFGEDYDYPTYISINAEHDDDGNITAEYTSFCL